MLPLCAGIDPGQRTGLAVVEPRLGKLPRLLLLRVVEGDSPDAWAEHAFLAAEAVAVVVRREGRPLVGWAEIIPPTAEDGWQTALSLAERRGQLRQALADAGLPIAAIEDCYLQTWTSRLGVPRGKQGTGAARGQHRILEAERLVEMEPGTLRGLGKGTVDAAEAILIASARAVVAIGEARGISVAAPTKRAAKARRAVA